MEAKEGTNGQAAIEFVACIFLLLILVTGMIFLNRLAWASLFLQATLREKAGEEAMSDTSLARVPESIRDWNNGPDNIPYTADDRPQKGNASAVILQNLADASTPSPETWDALSGNVLVPVSMANLHQSPSASVCVPSIQKEIELRLDVPDFLRENVYGKDSVTLRENVWIPLLGGLY